MGDDLEPLDPDHSVALALEASVLEEDIEALRRRKRSTIGAGLVMTVIFVLGGMFMEQTGTLWFLGAMWLLLAGRLALINRASSVAIAARSSPAWTV